MARHYGYHKLTDEQSKLAGDNINLVWWYIKEKLLKHGKIVPDEIDECAGHLLWHLCMVCENFDPTYGVKFSTYALRGMHSGYLRYIDLRDKFYNHYIPTDFVIREGVSSDNELKDEPVYVDQSENYPITWDDIKWLFSFIEMDPLEEQTIFFYFEQHYSQTEIGKVLGYSKERIRQLLQSVLAKLQNAVSEHGIEYQDVISA